LRPRQAAVSLSALVLLATGLGAEPIFLGRQYNRCTACHYSPTGGGLLTPYGRSLSRQELSTTGRSDPSVQAAPGTGEQAFLFGATGDALGPLDLGIDLRPSHLSLGSGPTGTDRNLLMTADLLAAWRSHGWTVYGEFGRQPRLDGTKWDSYEHWVGYQSENGLGFRVGRFLPAYGIRFADHTAYTRAGLGLAMFDQLYALELSKTGDHHLLQFALSPGRADSIVHDDGQRAFTTSGRLQLDLGSRNVLVFSGLYRGKATLEPANGAGGIAFGIAPARRLSIWTEADAQFRSGSSGAPAYTLLNETSLEVYPGLWLKISPQLRTDYGDTSGGSFRWAFEANLLPRTHWNVGLSYYRDKTRASGSVFETFLAQLHLYL